MYNLIQRNKKKLLAVFGVLLMVAFTLPSSNLLNGRRSVMDAPKGYTSTRTITVGDMAQAHGDWELLSRTRTYLPEAGGLVPYTATLGQPLVKQINDHPDLYVLLQDEARSLGLSVSDDRVEDAINRNPFLRGEGSSEEFRNAMRGFLLVEAYINRLSTALKATEPRIQHYIDSAALQVRANLAELTAEKFKQDGPIPDAALQAHFDKYVHHTSATTGPTTATAPTTTTTATSPSTSPATTSAADVLTFDYKYPDRVKFQYLAVDVKQLRSVVRKTKEESRWEVDAFKYYLTHQSEFPPKPVMPASAPATLPATAPAATAPATTPAASPAPAATPARAPAATPAAPSSPATPGAKPPAPDAKPADKPKPSTKEESELEKPSSRASDPIEDQAVLAADVQPAAAQPAPAAAPASKPAASAPTSAPAATAPAATAPTVRPYAEVKEEILDKLMEPEVRKLGAQLVDKVGQRLTADFDAYRKLDPAAQKAAGSYGTFEYLERVAGEIEKQQGVRPAVVSKASDWTAVNDLWKTDEGLGSAVAGQDRIDDLARALSAFGGKTLQLLEFAKPLTTPPGGFYFVRFTDADKSHEPAALAEVKDRVEADVRLARGYTAARAAAEKLLADAQLRGVASAAASAGAKFSATGTFTRQYANQMGQFAFMPIPGYDEVDPDVKSAMVTKAFELVGQASKTNPHPRAVLDLPEQRKVMVVEVSEITRPFSGSRETQVIAQLRSGLPAEDVAGLVMSYLSYDAVKARLGYRLEHPEEERNKDKDKDADAQAQR